MARFCITELLHSLSKNARDGKIGTNESVSLEIYILLQFFAKIPKMPASYSCRYATNNTQGE